MVSAPRSRFSSTNGSFDNRQGINGQLEEEKEEGDLARRFQSLSTAQQSSPSGSTLNNPFLNTQSTAATSGYNPFVATHDYSAQPAYAPSVRNPFLGQANNSSAPYTQRSGQRAETPFDGHSAYSAYASNRRSANAGTASAGYLEPPAANPAFAMPSHDGRKRRSQTPANGYSNAQQYGDSIGRPRTSQDRTSSQSSSEHSSVSSAK
jgi:hypothetical protein